MRSRMGDFIEENLLAQVAVVVFATLLIAYAVVWFPYGFVVGDLTLNPMAWTTARRAILIGLWIAQLAILSMSANC